jgi:hypothetical protein
VRTTPRLWALAALALATPFPQSVQAQAQAQPGAEAGCCYVELQVVAEGSKPQFPDRPPIPLAGRVHVNGRYIGDTPLADGFPPGDYEITVEYQGVLAHRQVVRLAPGAPRRIRASVTLKLSADEQAALAAQQREQERAAAADRDARWKAEYAAALASWNTEHAAWEQETRPRFARRRTLGTAAWITAASGAALAITGGVLLATAANQDDEAQALFQTWALTTDAQERARLESEIDAHQDKRDRMQASGVTLLVTGGAALVTSGVLLLLRPSVRDEPQRPHSRQAGVDLLPFVAPRAAGLVVDGRF